MRSFLGLAPGVFWTAIIMLLTLGATWLNDYFGGLPWVPPVAGLVLSVLVPVLRELAKGAAVDGVRGSASVAPTVTRSFVQRMLL